MIFKDLFLLVFSATKHYMEEMRIFLWLFSLIFSAIECKVASNYLLSFGFLSYQTLHRGHEAFSMVFLFDFLSYQMHSSNIITFFLYGFFGFFFFWIWVLLWIWFIGWLWITRGGFWFVVDLLFGGCGFHYSGGGGGGFTVVVVVVSFFWVLLQDFGCCYGFR